MTETSFVVYHEDFRQHFMIKQISETENVTRWIDMHAHSNVVTCFESFKDRETGFWFQMTELHNGGHMFDYIKDLQLDLSLDVTRKYREHVFDVAI